MRKKGKTTIVLKDGTAGLKKSSVERVASIAPDITVSIYLWNHCNDSITTDLSLRSIQLYPWQGNELYPLNSEKWTLSR